MSSIFAPLYMSQNAGGRVVGHLWGLSYWVQPYTGAQINFRDLTPYLTYALHKPANRAMHFFTLLVPITQQPEAGVLDEPDSAKPAQLSSHSGPPGYIGWTQLTVPAYVDWRVWTASSLSGVSWLKDSSKTPATGQPGVLGHLYLCLCLPLHEMRSTYTIWLTSLWFSQGAPLCGMF